jgi:hypothetical protein
MSYKIQIESHLHFPTEILVTKPASHLRTSSEKSLVILQFEANNYN